MLPYIITQLFPNVKFFPVQGGSYKEILHFVHLLNALCVPLRVEIRYDEQNLWSDENYPTQCLKASRPHPPIGREAARCKNFLPPKPTKTSPMSPPPYKAKQKFAHVVAGTWGKFSVREGGLEGRIPSFKRGRSPSKVFPITSSCLTCCSGRLWRALRRTCSPGACPGNPSSRADPSA